MKQIVYILLAIILVAEARYHISHVDSELQSYSFFVDSLDERGSVLRSMKRGVPASQVPDPEVNQAPDTSVNVSLNVAQTFTKTLFRNWVTVGLDSFDLDSDATFEFLEGTDVISNITITRSTTDAYVGGDDTQVAYITSDIGVELSFAVSNNQNFTSVSSVLISNNYYPNGDLVVDGTTDTGNDISSITIGSFDPFIADLTGDSEIAHNEIYNGNFLAENFGGVELANISVTTDTANVLELIEITTTNTSLVSAIYDVTITPEPCQKTTIVLDYEINAAASQNFNTSSTLTITNEDVVVTVTGQPIGDFSPNSVISYTFSVTDVESVDSDITIGSSFISSGGVISGTEVKECDADKSNCVLEVTLGGNAGTATIVITATDECGERVTESVSVTTDFSAASSLHSFLF